jgi:hypothetical protein
MGSLAVHESSGGTCRLQMACLAGQSTSLSNEIYHHQLVLLKYQAADLFACPQAPLPSDAQPYIGTDMCCSNFKYAELSKYTNANATPVDNDIRK